MSFELAVKFVHETSNAILVEDPVSDEKIWLPLSQVEEIHRHKGGDTGTVVMSDWIARQKGLL